MFSGIGQVKFPVPVIARLRKAWPEALLVVIRESDLASQWAAIVAFMTGHPQPNTFQGIDAFPSSKLTREGALHLKTIRMEDEPQSVKRWLEQTTLVVSKHGLNNDTPEIAGGGIWTPDQIRISQEIFENDFAELQKFENLILAENAVSDLL